MSVVFKIPTLHLNSLWLLFARVTAQGLAVLLVAITARRLGVADFGQFALIGAVLQIGNTFTNFGTDTYLIREFARAGKLTDLLTRALGLQLLLSALWVVVTLLIQPNSLILIYSLALFPLAFFSIATISLRALERMDLVWTLSLIYGFIQLIAAFFSWDISTLCLTLLIGHFLNAAISYLICRALISDFSLFPIQNIFPLLKRTLPFAALTLLLVLSQRLGMLTVSGLLGDSPTGIFSAVLRIVEGLKLGHYAILGALLPVISRGTQSSRKSFRRGFIYLAGLSFLMAIGLSLFPSLLILILFGEQFTSAATLLALLGWSLLPYTVSSFISYDLIAHGREMDLLRATSVSLIIYLALYFWLISSYGLDGAVYAALVGEIIQAIIFLLFQSKSVVA